MEFRLWIIYKRISKIAKNVYYSRFLCWFRNTLFFNFAIMTILVLGIVYVLFLFLPSEANVYFSDQVSELEFSAGSVSGTLKTDHINLQIESDCKIRLDNFCINYKNEKYENVQYLLLSIKKDIPFSLIGIQRNDGTTTSAFFADPSLIEKKNSIRCFNKEIIFNNGILLGGLESAEYKVWITGANVTALDSNNTEIFEATDFFFEINENVNGIACLTTDVKTTIITPNISKKYNELPDVNYCSADFEGVNNATYVGSGDLLFSTSVSPKTYSIHKQTVDLHGVANQLDATVRITEDPLEDNVMLIMNGKVDEAYISDMTLFPTFSGWYIDNIYLAPLSLVSIVFGSISLLKKKEIFRK